MRWSSSRNGPWAMLIRWGNPRPSKKPFRTRSVQYSGNVLTFDFEKEEAKDMTPFDPASSALETIIQSRVRMGD